MKRLLRKLKIVLIDVYIYQMIDYKPTNIANNYAIKTSVEGEKTRYFIEDNDRVVHKSYLIPNVFLLNSIKKNGLAIGDCVTVKSHRGKSIYPYVINKIAKDVLDKKEEDIYVIVNVDNQSSIKGIEKARFTKIASVNAKRWLWFYLKKKVKNYN
ncbi:hypothetical protein [Psychroserpens ponticola]|uniref:Uncharacterized protein n=1 Tax=Psychroserpens ponticola TaxID=2932268 RepID=A0ABY7RZG7_9FLAO|nr:hypothetical protein [Psychroserpens ponticola]WCO02546.1 hypothetical protein MUN68_003395 [Psychroserpens ponticola]